MLNLQYILYYVALLIILSAFSLVLYGWDKRQAKANGRRIPENSLHLVALLGGWPGAILGQTYFRHKTHKQPFRVLFWCTVVAHIGMVIALWYGLG